MTGLITIVRSSCLGCRDHGRNLLHAHTSEGIWMKCFWSMQRCWHLLYSGYATDHQVGWSYADGGVMVLISVRMDSLPCMVGLLSSVSLTLVTLMNSCGATTSAVVTCTLFLYKLNHEFSTKKFYCLCRDMKANFHSAFTLYKHYLLRLLIWACTNL